MAYGELANISTEPTAGPTPMITLVLEHDNEWLQVTGDGDTVTLLSLPPSIGFLAVISGSVL